MRTYITKCSERSGDIEANVSGNAIEIILAAFEESFRQKKKSQNAQI